MEELNKKQLYKVFLQGGFTFTGHMTDKTIDVLSFIDRFNCNVQIDRRAIVAIMEEKEDE